MPHLRLRPTAMLLAVVGLTGCSDTFDGIPVGEDGVSNVVGWTTVADGPEIELPPGAALSPQRLPAAGDTPEFTLVNLWASTCGPCRREMPVLNELVGHDDLQVVGVSRDQFARYAREFEDEVDAAFPSWLDADGTWTQQLADVTNTFALPVSVLLREGRAVAAHVGEIEDAGDVVEQMTSTR